MAGSDGKSAHGEKARRTKRFGVVIFNPNVRCRIINCRLQKSKTSWVSTNEGVSEPQKILTVCAQGSYMYEMPGLAFPFLSRNPPVTRPQKSKTPLSNRKCRSDQPDK